MLRKYYKYCFENFRYTLHNKKNIGSQGYLKAGSIDSLEIPVPPMPVQEEIVRILDKFTELETELSMRKKQYDAIMSKLSELIQQYCPDGVEYDTLSNLGTFLGGLTGKSKLDFTDGNRKFITYKNVFSNLAIDLNVTDTVKIIEGEKQHTLEYGDVIFTGSSEIKDETGLTSVLTQQTNEKLYLNSFCFIFRFNSNVFDKFNPEFSKYLFRCYDMRKAITRCASGVTRYNISKEMMKDIKIPIVPMPVQEEIVRILDKFSKLTTDISEGLPAEIKMRHQQYEYYRDKLLSFKRLEKN